ncbi:MAG: hypothetical protein Q9183_005115 [Haloplaca sp. 2 TL-2023]
METLERTFAPLERYHIDIFGFCEDAREDAAYCRSKLGDSRPPKKSPSDTDTPSAEPETVREAQGAVGAAPTAAREDGFDGPLTTAGRRRVAHSNSSRRPTGFFGQRFSRGGTSASTTEKSIMGATESRPRRRLSKARRVPSAHKRTDAYSLHHRAQFDDEVAMSRAREGEGVRIEGNEEDGRKGKGRASSPASSEITYNEGRVMFGRRNSDASVG